MRHINLETWSRRDHFKIFSAFDYPHFSMCANVDLTSFYSHIKQRGISFNIAIVYILARAANTIPEFRYRIRGKEVVEHEIIHPSSTILINEDVFSFCHFDYIEGFSLFAEMAAKKIAYAKEYPTLEDGPGQDNQFYMTAIPWVSFTSFMHPLNIPVDSVPRLAWGKFFKEGESLKMPLSIQAHHALMDGIHMGRYFEIVQGYLVNPGGVLGEG